MPQIDIEIEYPKTTLALIAGACVFAVMQWSGVTSAQAQIGGRGGDANASQNSAVTVARAEQNIAQLREEQQVLSRREDILRTQLDVVQRGMDVGSADEAQLAQMRGARDDLLILLSDKKAAEDQIHESLTQIQEAQALASAASVQQDEAGVPFFAWPVEPLLGVSARFNDAAYQQHFGMPHHAIDIPVNQGSPVRAAADGTVVKVSDQGMGFNSVVVRHSGGFATLYGHVSGFAVAEGQQVKAGQIIAYSGGTPGTPGAGRMTTGPHLHVQFMLNGTAVDPLQYLPSRSEVSE